MLNDYLLTKVTLFLDLKRLLFAKVSADEFILIPSNLGVKDPDY